MSVLAFLMMDNLSQLPPDFLDFIFQGLDHGITSIAEGGGPLVPFVMSRQGERKNLYRFVTERYEDGVAAAEQHIRSASERPDWALLAFDGYLPWEGRKYDAIFVRAFARQLAQGVRFAQRYVPRADGRPGIEPTGNAALLGQEPNLLLA